MKPIDKLKVPPGFGMCVTVSCFGQGFGLAALQGLFQPWNSLFGFALGKRIFGLGFIFCPLVSQPLPGLCERRKGRITQPTANNTNVVIGIMTPGCS